MDRDDAGSAITRLADYAGECEDRLGQRIQEWWPDSRKVPDGDGEEPRTIAHVGTLDRRVRIGGVAAQRRMVLAFPTSVRDPRCRRGCICLEGREPAQLHILHD